MPRLFDATRWIVPLLGLWLVAGCSQPKIAGDGRAVDAPDRIPALVRQTERPGNEGLAELVRALDDDDPAVRLFAAQALRERTGQDFGYRYFDSARQRRPAVRRWRDWLDGQDGPPHASPAPESPSRASATPDTASAP